MRKEFQMTPQWVVLAALCVASAGAQTLQPQRTFDTAQSAADALIAAAEHDDTQAILDIFGPGGKDLLESGDAVQDKNARLAFLSSAHDKKSVALDPKNPNRATLAVG